MSSTITARDFVRLAQQRRQALDATYRENLNAQQDYEKKRGALQNGRDQALTELTELLLPALTREAVAAVESLTGFRAFAVKDPFAALAELRERLTANIASCEIDPRYLNREQLVNEAAGDLTLKFNEIARKKSVLDQGLALYTSEPGFVELVECCYGTSLYAKHWWELSYYSDWKRGDELEEKLAPLGAGETPVPFAEHAERYRRVKEAVDAYQADLQAAEQEIRDVRQLVELRDNSAQGLLTAARDVLQQSRADLRAHLEFLDREDLARRGAARAEVVVALKKLHGLEKKIEYLDELRGHYLEPEQALHRKQVDKLGGKIAKFTRPKNAAAAIPVAEANAWLADPLPKLKERRSRYREAYNRVYNFQNYDRYQYGGGALWWDLILEGLLNGDFVPEVRDHRARFPQGQKRRDIYASTMQPDATRGHDLLEVS